MRRYYHYKKRSRPFPVEILSAMRGDMNIEPSPTLFDFKPIREHVKRYRASFEMVGSGLIKAVQGLCKQVNINSRKSGI